MADSDIRSITTTDLTGGVTGYSVDTKNTDGVNGQGETEWTFKDFPQWYGYYDSIPELKKAIQTYATWVVGKGYEAINSRGTVILDKLNGWGEDTFLSIMWNMLVMKKVNGDAFAEIVKSPKGTLINLKPLAPNRVKIIVNNNGIIKRYEYLDADGKNAIVKFKPSEILHLCNDRVADNIHGDSVIKALKWTIDTIQEAMSDWRRISHRSTIRILYVDEDNTTKLNTMKTTYKDAINKGELLILPAKKEDASFEDLQLPPLESFLGWIRYQENRFYKAVGVPKTIAGDAEGIPESGGKMAMLTHEPTYLREVTELEEDIWNQLGIRVSFNKQASLQDNVQQQEGKNNNQTQTTQPSEVRV